MRGSHSRSVANFPGSVKNELSAIKKKKEFDMATLMKRELDQNEMKKITQRKYEMLLNKEREE